MHDIAELDRRGVPGCAVATVEFEVAADAQARALGFAPALHFVPHPIQGLTEDELAAVADGAVAGIIPLIQRPADR